MMKSIGTLTLGSGTDNQRTIQLTEILRCEFKDNRIATIAKCEELNYLLTIQNPKNSGRQPEAMIYVTEGSLVALLATTHLFMDKKNFNLSEKMKEYSIESEKLSYEYHSIEETEELSENH